MLFLAKPFLNSTIRMVFQQISQQILLVNVIWSWILKASYKLCQSSANGQGRPVTLQRTISDKQNHNNLPNLPDMRQQKTPAKYLLSIKTVKQLKCWKQTMTPLLY